MHRRYSSTWIRTAGAALTLLLGLLALSSCGLLPVPDWQVVRPTPAATTYVVPATRAALPPPRATATPVPTPTPEPEPTPAVSQVEAESVVRAWFDALAAEDYSGIESLTADDAALHTRALTDTLRLEAERENVELDVISRRVDARHGLRTGRGEAVDTDFQIDINALVGPFSFAVRQILGTATFIVDRVGDEVKIVDIQNVTGLPEVAAIPSP